MHWIQETINFYLNRGSFNIQTTTTMGGGLTFGIAVSQPLTGIPSGAAGWVGTDEILIISQTSNIIQSSPQEAGHSILSCLNPNFLHLLLP